MSLVPPILAASRLQPSHAAVAEATSGEAQVGTQMTINGLSFSRRRLQPSTSGDDVGTRMTIGPSYSFNPSRCVAMPPGYRTRNLLVWWQQEGKADCTAIQFFPSPTCTGRVMDTLAQGQFARCIIGATQSAAPPEYPDEESSSNQGWEAVSSITVAGSDWRCKDVYTVYGLTLQQFTHMNPDINCSALLPQGRDLIVQELLEPCSAFYYTQLADTCSSVAQFLDITEESLEELNPGVGCSSRLLAFRPLCVERDPAKTKPSCENVIEIGKVEDFQQVAASNGATMVDLCRLNP
ncbi:unnamed protein product [Closterium sp. Naga37s-1]|nr:unnamed protein product [Closterium sp. Naga37s-1]